MEQPGILAVEDNPTLQKMLSLMAKRRGVPAIIVGTCAEAMDALKSDATIGLILMDWSLPDKDGLECTLCIRRILKSELPIIAMTGHTMPGDREACMNAGMDDYLSKPFSFDQFNKVVDRWLKNGKAARNDEALPQPPEELSWYPDLPSPTDFPEQKK